MSPNKNNTLVSKEKALSIHIHTDTMGPHGMPLVYGSTLSKVGSIQGTVRFNSNYDCKGRDIQIIYEAWIESTWISCENKKLIHHHSREVFGYQTWSFPLVHTKSKGSTVAAGVYEKQFDAVLEHPLAKERSDYGSARRSMDSTSSSCTSHSADSAHSSSGSVSTARSTSTSYTRNTSPAASSISSTSRSSSSRRSSSSKKRAITSPIATSILYGGMTVLPSSCYSFDTKIRYTIRAVLKRPFPSLSNMEASQEIWVVNSNTTADTSSLQQLQSSSTVPRVHTESASSLMATRVEIKANDQGLYTLPSRKPIASIEKRQQQCSGLPPPSSSSSHYSNIIIAVRQVPYIDCHAINTLRGSAGNNPTSWESMSFSHTNA
ncbi:hypothetical protein EDD11_000790 [Mortierella claussenii]|nr:hypothetical protein EDD11_000790 [Mortierella claussenii]